MPIAIGVGLSLTKLPHPPAGGPPPAPSYLLLSQGGRLLLSQGGALLID